MKAGWKTRSLAEVCRLINGKAYKKAELLESGPYPVLRVGNFFTSDHWYYSDLELDDEKYCDEGDLLYAWSASFGPRIWQGEKSIYHYHIWKVVPDAAQLDKKFLYHFFEWDKELIKKEHGAGATMIHVSKGSMEARKISFPPLEEQRRIIAILDEAFEGLSRARVNVEANLLDAEAVEQGILNGLLSQFARVNGKIAIGEFASVKGGKRLPKGYALSKEATPYPYISVKDFTDNGTVSMEGIGFISEAVQKTIARYTISSRDVYISIAGTIGKTGIVPQSLEGANLTENAAKLVLANDWAPEYVYWCTKSDDFRLQVLEQTRTAAQPKLALQRLAEISIPSASEEQQAVLIAKMNQITQSKSGLRLCYIKQQRDIELLRQSLLQKAFAGELTVREFA